MRYIVAELGPYILCERGVNPIEILETLNCMGTPTIYSQHQAADVLQLTPPVVLLPPPPPPLPPPPPPPSPLPCHYRHRLRLSLL